MNKGKSAKLPGICQAMEGGGGVGCLKYRGIQLGKMV